MIHPILQMRKQRLGDIQSLLKVGLEFSRRQHPSSETASHVLKACHVPGSMLDILHGESSQPPLGKCRNSDDRFIWSI